MRRFRFSIRSLMIATMFVGFDSAVLARSLPWNDGLFLIAAMLACANALPFAYAWIVAEAIRTRQEDQSLLILLTLYLLAATFVLVVPILVILLMD